MTPWVIALTLASTVAAADPAGRQLSLAEALALASERDERQRISELTEAQATLAAHEGLGCRRCHESAGHQVEAMSTVIRLECLSCHRGVHDVDFIRWVFGHPSTVDSVGSTRHLRTRYRFGSVPGFVEAEGGWLPGAQVPFRMTYRAVFEEAVAEFDIGAEKWLTLYRGEAVEHPELPTTPRTCPSASTSP